MLHESDYFTMSEVCNFTGYSLKDIWKMIANKQFPQPMIMGGKRVWLKEDLYEWANHYKLYW